MSTQCYLKNERPELHTILGVGEFAAHLPALPVPESIANQYDTTEAHSSAPPPEDGDGRLSEPGETAVTP